jgi:hypothetical protein
VVLIPCRVVHVPAGVYPPVLSLDAEAYGIVTYHDDLREFRGGVETELLNETVSDTLRAGYNDVQWRTLLAVLIPGVALCNHFIQYRWQSFIKSFACFQVQSSIGL